jgi:tetratricopeptide (TPR) repeat protein
MRKVALAVLIALAATAAVTPVQAGIDPSELAQDESRTSVAELERITAGLRDGNDANRRAAAKSVQELGPEATGAITARLTTLRKASDDVSVLAVVQNSIAADPIKANADDFDMVAALLAPQKREGTEPWYVALETACLMHALAHIGTTPAARQIVIASDDHKGALRAEAARLMHRLGDKGVPALPIARTSSSIVVRKWATTQLEVMGKKSAADAVQTKSNQVLSDVLRAFGTTHDVDAVPVVLSFVNSDRAQVRVAARDAVGAYGKDALWKLREAYSNLVAKPAPDDWSAERVARELFAAYDRSRLEDVYALLGSGLDKQRKGDLDGAISDFDRVLARQPQLDRRAEMASGYVLWAQSKEDSDRTGALAAYRKAARLDPDGPRSKQVEGAIAYLEGEELLARGVIDTTPFERALAADPGNAKAQAELDRLEADGRVQNDRLKRASLVFGIVALAVALIVLFGGRRPRRRIA